MSRYERLVFSVAIRNGASRDDAADITQMTFLALLDQIDVVHDDDRLSSWLMTVARRSTWRLNRRTTHRTDDVTSASESSIDPIGDWEQLAEVYDALLRLPPQQRELIFALYFDPRSPSYVEVAIQLGLAVGTIGPMRARSLARLRELLALDEHG